jgi:hypothetical protein
MKYTFLIYITVAILAASLARFKADIYSWFLLLEFFVGFTQVIGSIIRYIIFLKYKSQDNKTIFKYWMMVTIYTALALLASHYYEANITNPMFDESISYNIVILSLAWPIAFWYMFNISFLKSKQL